MNEEIKKLIESVEILYCYGNEKDSFQTYEKEACIRKSDFDKVVKELEYLSELRKPSEDIKQAIKEAAEKYQEDVYSDVYEESSLSEQKLECILDFKAGAEFALKLSENSGQLNESSSRSQDNGDNFISKETMFDFVRWLREDDRFNGGQSLKMVFDKFINTENQNK